MKKFTNLLVLILMVVLVLAGCASDDQAPASTTASQTTTSQTTESVAAEGSTEGKTEGASDNPLTGMALIESLDYKMPSKVYLKGTTTAEGLSFTMTIYLEGESMRYETTGLEGDQVMIYDAEKGITYVYSVGEGTGFMYLDETEDEMEESESEEGFGMEESMPEFDEDPFSEIGSTLIKAELTTYKGHEVVYYETEMSSSEGTYITKQWISTEFWHPLMMETSIDGVVVNTYEIEEISDKYPGPGKPFEVPEDIEFLDFDNMFG